VTLRALSGVLAALAAASSLLIVVPLRARVGAARAESRALWAERQRVREQLAGLERREATWRRFALAAGDAEALSALRKRLIGSVDIPGLSGVRLEVQPGRPPIAATARLSAEGDFSAIIGLLTRLARPDAGLGISRVRIGSGRTNLAVDLEGFVAEAQP
jgi:hypothetical protein